ncbi:M20 family metallopeptidase [Arsenicicoccus sp. oral taxon 190]|uniref:M20 family metallopeptidase n=1 Tax=Arsenicicoccus sp. oral taxon 190 TaxID=1658671 RepID=UPI00067A0825|nr:M20 family metallopeptidase [Arsenicicoccus sp. oral taxon 190]AKT50746.1 acetylornithine deacetylase [Arsenicicoccus sp. oral taxon 190]
MVTAAERRVLELLDEAELVDLTFALVRARGENPGETEGPTVDVLAAACRERGLTVATREVAPGRPNLVATLPGSGSGSGPASGSGPGLLFLGHSDVVPAGPGWSGDPFEPRQEAGRLVGRGVADMKGGLAAVVLAVDAVRRAGVPLTGAVTLACTVDEEDLDLGIRDLVAQPDLLPGPYAACVVAEPTDLSVVVACRGDAYLEVEVTGVAAHSGRPADGRNAIDAAARIVDLVRADHERLVAAAEDRLGSGTWNVGRIEGGRGTSIVAPGCHLWLDRRLMPGEDPERIAAELRDRVEAAGIVGDGIGVELQVTMEMPGFETEPDHPLVTAGVDATRAVGRPGEVDVWTAACDGGFVVRDLGIPAVVLGPGSVSEQAHQADESVAVAELLDAARVYALLILRLVGTS